MRLGAWLSREAGEQVERWRLWRPVAFGAGAAVFFSLPREPSSLMIAAGLAVVLVLTLAARRLAGRPLTFIFISLTAWGVLGFVVGEVRARSVAAPIVRPGLGPVQIEGEVIDIRSPSAERWRLLIRPTRIAGLAEFQLPARVRVVSAVGDTARPGDRVRLEAILNPPPGPSSPGAYDFGRDAYFEQIGAVGAALSPVAVVDAEPLGGLEGVEVAINQWRWSLAQLLTEDLDRLRGPGLASTGLVAAVATSHEAWLPKASEEDLRGSGLAHMLAIAGLHTAAVTGFVYWAVRFGVAACPPIALRVSGKTLAAACGLAAVLVYLALSGAHPPARRAAITASVAFIAMLTGRRGISLHSLSLAALVVLALQPECIFQPGFQMSFCATGALVALAEAWRPGRERTLNAPWVIRMLQSAREAFIGLGVVATVAGAATGPFSLQHFNRTALYGTFANLIADFLASAIVMPAVAVSAVGEGLGLHHWLLAPSLMVAGLGSDGILAVGHLFTSLPGAVLASPSAPDIALLVSFVGLCFAIIWRGRLRWVGVAAAMAVAIWPRPPAPIGWLAPDGSNAGVVENGVVYSMRPAKRRFSLESFAQHRGLAISEDASRFDCNRDGCIDQSKARPRIAAWFTRRKPSKDRLAGLCDSDILVMAAAMDIPDTCSRPLVLRRSAFDQYGAAEITGTSNGWSLYWSQPQRGDRLWSAPPGGLDQ
jgi:competence protein ComEC